MSAEDAVTDFRAILPGRDELVEAFRRLSEFLDAPVNTLIAEGWSEAQARDIVAATYAGGARNGRTDQ